MKIDGFKVDGIANIEHAHLKIEELCALMNSSSSMLTSWRGLARAERVVW